ncbi:excisionase family DNA-binding protein [Okibacterium endophyticum]
MPPTQAAELLGVTRQFVDRLCEDGVLAFRRLPGSRHRRIRVQTSCHLGLDRRPPGRVGAGHLPRAGTAGHAENPRKSGGSLVL